MAPAQSNAGRQPKPLREKRARPAKAGSLGGKTTYDRHLEKDAAVVAGVNPAVMAKLTEASTMPTPTISLTLAAAASPHT